MRGAVVTGAGRRLGRALATALAADGWHVALHYNTSKRDAEDAVAEIAHAKGSAVAIQADLADPAAVQRVIADARAALGGDVHCLVNSASVFEPDTAGTFTVDSWDRHQRVNLRAPALLARDFAAALPSAETGVIVNLLDQKLFNLNPDFFSYTMSKIGLQGLTTMLATAYAPRVRVCGIAPGLTLPPPGKTAAQFEAAHRKAPLGQGSTVDDIVRTLRFILASPAITGETILVDGGQHLQPRAHDVMFDPSGNAET